MEYLKSCSIPDIRCACVNRTIIIKIQLIVTPEFIRSNFVFVFFLSCLFPFAQLCLQLNRIHSNHIMHSRSAWLKHNLFVIYWNLSRFFISLSFRIADKQTSVTKKCTSVSSCFGETSFSTKTEQSTRYKIESIKIADLFIDCTLWSLNTIVLFIFLLFFCASANHSRWKRRKGWW